MIKPDGVAKGLTGEIIRRFEGRGLRLNALLHTRLSRSQAEELYSVHKGKGFYDELVEFVLSGPVVLMVLSGDAAVETVREVMGATNPAEAAAGTIRADFAESITSNVIHGADSPESAEREIPIFFPELKAS